MICKRPATTFEYITKRSDDFTKTDIPQLKYINTPKVHKRLSSVPVYCVYANGTNLCDNKYSTHNHMPLIGFLRFSFFPISFRKTGEWCVHSTQSTVSVVSVYTCLWIRVRWYWCVTMCGYDSNSIAQMTWRYAHHQLVNDTMVNGKNKTCNFGKSFIPCLIWTAAGGFVLRSLAYKILTKFENRINSLARKSKYIHETNEANAIQKGNKKINTK